MALARSHLSLLRRLANWLSSPGDVPLVCEVAADYVVAVRHRGGHVEAWAARSLPEGAVRPAPLAENIANPTALRQALEPVLGDVADGHRRCVLLVPDLVARVAVLEFDQVGKSSAELDAMLRWRLGKDLPFDVGTAALAFETHPGHSGGQQVLVAVCLRNLLRQYEECLEGLGLQPGWVTLSTLAALGGMDVWGASPRLLVKRDRTSLSLAVAQEGAVRLFRSLPLPMGEDSSDDERLFDKIYPALVYFQDQWGQSVSEAVLAGAVGSRSGLARQLQHEVGCTLTEFNPADFDLPPSPMSGASPDARLLPSLGWVRGEMG